MHAATLRHGLTRCAVCTNANANNIRTDIARGGGGDGIKTRRARGHVRNILPNENII